MSPGSSHRPMLLSPNDNIDTAHGCIPTRGLGTRPKKMLVLHPVVNMFCAARFVISKPAKPPEGLAVEEPEQLRVKLREVSAPLGARARWKPRAPCSRASRFCAADCRGVCA